MTKEETVNQYRPSEHGHDYSTCRNCGEEIHPHDDTCPECRAMYAEQRTDALGRYEED